MERAWTALGAWRLTSVYSAVCFIVGFARAFLIFRMNAPEIDRYTCFLIYNFCAFAMQMPLGTVADRLNRNMLFAADGCSVAGLSYLLTPLPFAAVAAMFVVGTVVLIRVFWKTKKRTVGAEDPVEGDGGRKEKRE